MCRGNPIRAAASALGGGHDQTERRTWFLSEIVAKRSPYGSKMEEKIEVGFQTFVSDGGEEFGAVRAVSPQGRAELVIYVENAGDFAVPLDAVESVHSGKVIF